MRGYEGLTGTRALEQSTCFEASCQTLRDLDRSRASYSTQCFGNRGFILERPRQHTTFVEIAGRTSHHSAPSRRLASDPPTRHHEVGSNQRVIEPRSVSIFDDEFNVEHFVK
ncbi:hypothetical protein ASE34_01095 [Microbacterium sp. Root280D1]|nr:hypothetical protein ASE34_01095 [Microbacterium sp. Root280D1]